MNTEINFLKKKPKKYTDLIPFGVVFVLLLAIVVGILLVQKNGAAAAIKSEEIKISKFKNLLVEHQKENASMQHLQQLQLEIVQLKEEAFPTIALYEEVLGLLAPQGQLISYDFKEEDQFIIDAEFSTLEAVAGYVTSLLEKGYVMDTQLTAISSTESSYQATLTILIDVKVVVEELVEHGQTME